MITISIRFLNTQTCQAPISKSKSAFETDIGRSIFLNRCRLRTVFNFTIKWKKGKGKRDQILDARLTHCHEMPINGRRLSMKTNTKSKCYLLMRMFRECAPEINGPHTPIFVLEAICLVWVCCENPATTVNRNRLTGLYQDARTTDWHIPQVR